MRFCLEKNNCPICDQAWNKKECSICGHKKQKKIAVPKVKEQKSQSPKVSKPQKTESELVFQYAKTLIGKYQTRGQVSDKFKELKSEGLVNKDLWQDKDFYLSVVFASVQQKYQFLEFLSDNFGILTEADDLTPITIVNGIELSEKLGCPLKKEVAENFPLGNLELKDFVLDEETINNEEL